MEKEHNMEENLEEILAILDSGTEEEILQEEPAAPEVQEEPAAPEAQEEPTREAPTVHKKKWILPSVIAAVVIIAAALVWLFTQNVFVAGDMYSIRSETMDLRGKELTEEEFLELEEKMPQCYIIWDVPFQNGKVASNSEEITISSLTEEDISSLDYLTELKTVHGENCDDSQALSQLQLHRPEIQVLYSVTISGESFPQDTKELAVSGLSEADAALLSCLHDLQKVEVSGCDDYALLQQLQTEQPQWNLTYTVALGEEEIPWDSKEVLAKYASGEELALAITGLPMLKTLDVTNPLADYAELNALREQYPDVKLNWVVELFGQTFTEDVTEVDISGNLVENYQDVEQVMACLPKLEKLIMSDCGIDSETMAEFRERQRANYKVVWTVYLGEICKMRTDEIFFHPVQQGEYYLWDEDTPELKYCEDMICLDLGHHKIRNIDFCRYMPKLKYLILAHTLIRDVSALVGCQELIFLEVDWSELRDYTPLRELKALEDLNLNRTYCDVTPLLEMTWLKNLWAPGRGYTARQQLIAALPDTRLELNSANVRGWRHLPNYYDMRDVLGMPYMDQ